MRHFTFSLLAAIAAMPSIAFAQEPPDFDRDIRPILADNCYNCHGPDPETREAELRLDTREGLFSPHNELAIVAPGRASDSELIRRVTSDDEFTRMPPPDSNRTLSEKQVELLKSWVAAGAPWSGHWAWTRPVRPPLPAVEQADWPQGAIDRFILARLEQEGIQPQRSADKQTLIRRATLDLTGLPPTPEETAAFLADDSPDAYHRLIDRLLSSPAYGERMVWEWLDAARYADTNGYQGDPERTMWPWRDWAVDALNANMPFDQFTIEQIAGDLLPSATQEQILATGFNRNHMHNGEGGRIAEETRVENVMDRVETTATVWMGATVGCARCHDHKFDPFTQREYYQLYAFFNNTSEAGRGGRNIPPLLRYTSPQDQQRLERLAEEVERRAAEVVKIEAERYALAENSPPNEDGEPAKSPREALPEDLRGILDQPPAERKADSLKRLSEAVQDRDPPFRTALTELAAALERREAMRQSLPEVMVMDTIPTPRETHILVRGTYDKPADPVVAGTPAILPPLVSSEPPDRLDLARWLVSAEHPLTARVAVNRYWQLFFGTGLVKTVDDFGTQGEKPSHEELLDWLAVEFMESGWSVKHMHRLIVTSAAYQQSSAMTPESFERDPENRLLGRGPRYRLPSWMIRDQALAAAGLLIREVGGPPVKPYQPDGIWAEATFGQKRYQRDSGKNLFRRSVYTFWRRIVGPTMFFDTASRQTCVVSQTRTNTPLHALVTLNDITYVEAARALAQRVLEELPAADAEARLDLAYRRLLGRDPGAQERSILLARLEAMRQRYAGDADAAEALLSIGESARNRGLDAAEHAAWTTICSLLLNLDETLNKQ